VHLLEDNAGDARSRGDDRAAVTLDSIKTPVPWKGPRHALES